MAPQQSGPLIGIRVLDASVLYAAPLASTLLADFGADVIRIEDPQGGDPLRRTQPQVEGQSIFNKAVNRNKRAVALNLRIERGRAIFRRLVAETDVVVTNFRPSTLEAWGLDYDDLTRIRPDLIMLHLTGYGRTGPYRDLPAFARTAEAFAGLTYITGHPDRTPLYAGAPVADALGGVHGAFALMLALYHRRATGKGQLIDLALFEPTLALLSEAVLAYSLLGVVRERNGNIHPKVAPSAIYQTRDGKWLGLPSTTPNMYTRLCEALGRPDLLTDPRFADSEARVRARVEIEAEISIEVAKRTLDEVLPLLQAAGVAAGLVNSAADIATNPHIRERPAFTQVHDENLGRDIPLQEAVPRLSDSPGTIAWPGRELGQDTRQVLGELLGLTGPELDALARDKVIGA